MSIVGVPETEFEAAEIYLRLLFLERAKPSLEFLSQLVRRHLVHIPYENISKLLGQDRDSSLCGFVRNFRANGYGGTCFAKAVSFHQLLAFLGFDAQFIPMHDGIEVSHVALRVTIEGRSYLVDLGLGAEFAGPFFLAEGFETEARLGLRDYHLAVSDEIRMWIMQGRRVVKSYRAKTRAELSRAGVDEIWERSRRVGSPLMSHLCLHRVHEKNGDLLARMIWDHSYIEWQGGIFKKTDERERIVELANREFGLSTGAVTAALAKL